jgi:hypothetical protein
VKRRSTEEFESIPYICKLLNAYFWIYYGVIKPNSLLVATVNMFGAIVEIIFLTIFLLLAPSRMKVCFFDLFSPYKMSLTLYLFRVELLIFKLLGYAGPLLEVARSYRLFLAYTHFSIQAKHPTKNIMRVFVKH